MGSREFRWLLPERAAKAWERWFRHFYRPQVSLCYGAMRAIRQPIPTCSHRLALQGRGPLGCVRIRDPDPRGPGKRGDIDAPPRCEFVGPTSSRTRCRNTRLLGSATRGCNSRGWRRRGHAWRGVIVYGVFGHGTDDLLIVDTDCPLRYKLAEIDDVEIDRAPDDVLEKEDEACQPTLADGRIGAVTHDATCILRFPDAPRLGCRLSRPKLAIPSSFPRETS